MPSPRNKVPPYLLMLVVSFALLGLIGYQTLKDRKVSGDLLKQKESLLQEKVSATQKLELSLQKEKKRSLDLQEKLDKSSFQKEKLNGIKDGLHGQLIELERVKRLTEESNKQLESSLLEKDNEINDLRRKLDEKEEKLEVLKNEVTQKDSEINELRAQIKALGGQAIEKTGAESTNSSGSPGDDMEGKQEKEASEEELNAGKGISQKASEDEDKEDLKGEETADKHSDDQVEISKTTGDVQNLGIEDEESKVDDREDTLLNDDTGDEGDVEKTHEEEEQEEQPDVDIDAVNKTDLDENELAAME